MNRKPNFLNVLVSVLVGMTLLLSAAQPNLVSASTELGGGDGVRTSVHPQTGKLSFLGTDPSSPIRVDTAMRADLSTEGRGMAILDVYGPQFGLKNPQEELRLTSTREAEGRGMTKYQQLYQGIPVMAGELIVNTNAQGGLLSINGEVSPDLNISIAPSIDAALAQSVALQEIASAYGLSLSEVVASEPELWVYDARLMNGEDTTPAHLVWRMEVTSENAPLRELVLVNAQTGKVSLRFNQIDTAWGGSPFERVDGDAKALGFSAPVDAAQTYRAPAGGIDVPPAAPDPSLDRFVATTGVDIGDCSDYLNPCATIDYAIGQSAVGEKIGVAEGTYTGNGFHVVTLEKGVQLFGGWDVDFSVQTGYSIIDGENERRGMYVQNTWAKEARIDRFIVQNGNTVYNISDPGSGNGGGINTYPSVTLRITNSIIRNNVAPRIYQSGGGIYSWGGTITIENSAIIRNEAYSGGGLDIHGSTVQLKNVTISENTALQSSGGFYNGGYLTVLNSTISNNHAPMTNAFGGGLTIENSIVDASGPAACSLAGYVNAGVKSNGHNLFDGNCTMNYHATDIVSAYLGLGATLTKGYQPLLADSPAIDSGKPSTCTKTDARGLPRVACDIGAYEYAIPGKPTALWVNSGDNQVEGLGQPFSLPLSIVVLDAKGTPIPKTSVTFTAPLSGASIVFDESGTNEISRITDSSGVATTPVFSANTRFGSYLVTARTPSIAEPAHFSLTNFFWVVAPAINGGDDANDCLSPATPCATIQGALNKPDFEPGDKIGISIGVFNGDALTFTQDAILLGGWNTSFTKRNGATTLKYPLTIAEKSNVHIQNFSITGIDGTAITNHGDLLVEKTSIYGNKEGIYNDGDLTVVNSTIYGNKNTVKNPPRAGGITDAGKAWLINTTITGNRGGTGGLFSQYGTYLANTIVVGNSSILTNQLGADCRAANAFALISLDHNLIGRTSSLCESDWGSHDILGTNASPIPVSRVLGARLNSANGVSVYPLKLGSLALDAGSEAVIGSGLNSCAVSDQLGAARPQGTACDIGASEFVFDIYPSEDLLTTYTARHDRTLPGTLICSDSNGVCA
ncbi:MAG: hypothetical protein HY867_12760, partial [Chloroflexi bacterium]|nr:hypothetical protein [Chloroflexota bacterium]